MALHVFWSVVGIHRTTHSGSVSVPCMEAISAPAFTVAVVNANVRHCKSFGDCCWNFVEDTEGTGLSRTLVVQKLGQLICKATFVFVSDILGGRAGCELCSKSHRAHGSVNRSPAYQGWMRSNEGKQLRRVIAFKINVSGVQSMHDGCLPRCA